MFTAFYWKHFSIILYGKSQTVLIISEGSVVVCHTAFQQTVNCFIVPEISVYITSSKLWKEEILMKFLI